MSNQVRLGGSFAPPLDAQKLAQYRKLAEGASDPRVRDAMRPLCKMMEVFQETPPSALSAVPHPVGEFTDGDGTKYRSPAVALLEEKEIKRIWDYVPWDYETDALAALFETIDKAISERNSRKIQEWQLTVANAIIQKHFPDKTTFEKLQKALKNVGDWIGLLSADEAAKIQKQVDQVNACNAEFTRALSRKQYDGIPYPTLEPTPLRDAAQHLLWFARELTRDREPLTNDKVQRLS